jgi:hypothetical protein
MFRLWQTGTCSQMEPGFQCRQLDSMNNKLTHPFTFAAFVTWTVRSCLEIGTRMLWRLLLEFSCGWVTAKLSASNKMRTIFNPERTLITPHLHLHHKRRRHIICIYLQSLCTRCSHKSLTYSAFASLDTATHITNSRVSLPIKVIEKYKIV